MDEMLSSQVSEMHLCESSMRESQGSSCQFFRVSTSLVIEANLNPLSNHWKRSFIQKDSRIHRAIE